MVEGGEGSALELFRTAQLEEQECLFYVALSRARDRLFAYAPTKKANGNNWAVSPFLTKLGSKLTQCRVAPSRDLPGAAEDASIKLSVVGGLSFRGEQMSLYENCPRRFFYTHVLQIGGRRTATAFMQMHEAIRTVFRAVIDGSAPVANDEELKRRVADAFAAHGLADHGYVDDYKALALPMLRYFASTREGHTPEVPTALSLTFNNERIIVRPDDVLINPDGKRTFRRVKTGHQRSTDSEDVEAAALMIAAKQAFPDATIELVYLSDQKAEALSMSSAKLENRRQKLDEFLKDIRLGRFPANPSPRTCPSCPAFFICGPTPQGVLRKEV